MRKREKIAKNHCSFAGLLLSLTRPSSNTLLREAPNPTHLLFCLEYLVILDSR